MLSRRTVNLGILAAAGLAAGPTAAAATDLRAIELPPPWKDAGKPLAQAVWARRSTREFADKPVPIEVLSNLLWSACGVNRPATADRTVPSWRHAIESEIFVAAADGAWSYDAKAHRLTQVLTDDIRAQTGVQDFVGTAPLDLVYVADGSRLEGASADEKRLWAYTDTGFIGQNVYLFCASEGLATVFRGSLDRTRLAQTLQLPVAKFVTCAQTVGYPKV
ncbi:MAG: nitroreductase family protein [Roseiarcus sp.]|jgi:nitroreductase